MRDVGVMLLDRGLQIGDDVAEHLPAVGCDERLLARACARIGQQVVDQHLHPPCAVDGEIDEIVGVRVELALVVPLQKLAVAGHHPQRLLQIVRGHVGKLFEFGVRSRVVGRLLRK